MAVVRLDKVCKRFGDALAVDDFSLVTEDGEFVVLVGPSGCGKSTTLRMIAGLEDMDSGTLTFDDRPMQDVPVQDRAIAMVFQSYALYPHRNVYDNLGFALKLRNYSKRQIDESVRAAARTLDIEPLLQRKPKELSGGQRQRVALGRAIVREPDVFLMDEPLSNLDAKLRVSMRAEIAKLHRRLGVTTFYVTHDQVEAMTMGDRIVVMNEGVIQQIATPLTLYDQPVNLYVAGLIGNPPMNFVAGQINDAGDRVAASGLSFVLDPSTRKALEQRGSRQVTAGFRPEHLFHRRDDTADHGGTIQGTIELVEQLGSTTNIELDVDGKALTAELTRDQTLRLGETIALGLMPGRLHLFDPESGQRLSQADGSGQHGSSRKSFEADALAAQGG